MLNLKVIRRTSNLPTLRSTPITRRHSRIKRLLRSTRIVNSRRTYRAILTLRPTRRIRRLTLRNRIRQQHQLINSRRQQIRHRNTHSTSTLTLTTQRLIQRPTNRVNKRLRLVRRFGSTLTPIHLTRPTLRRRQLTSTPYRKLTQIRHQSTILRRVTRVLRSLTLTPTVHLNRVLPLSRRHTQN